MLGGCICWYITFLGGILAFNVRMIGGWYFVLT